jgi:hypothetical protein
MTAALVPGQDDPVSRRMRRKARFANSCCRMRNFRTQGLRAATLVAFLAGCALIIRAAAREHSRAKAVRVAAGGFLVVGLSLTALLLPLIDTATVCWQRTADRTTVVSLERATQLGRPSDAGSWFSGSVGPQGVGDGAGCDGGVPTANSVGLAVAALAAGVAVAIVVVPRRAVRYKRWETRVRVNAVRARVNTTYPPRITDSRAGLIDSRPERARPPTRGPMGRGPRSSPSSAPEVLRRAADRPRIPCSCRRCPRGSRPLRADRQLRRRHRCREGLERSGRGAILFVGHRVFPDARLHR